MTQAFPRHRRLLCAADFANVFERATRSSDRLFTVLATANTDTEFPRLGMAIARKHVRHAVARNRLKRIAREVFRTEASQLAAIDFVVMARPQAVAASKTAIAGSLRSHFRSLSDKARREPQAVSDQTG